MDDLLAAVLSKLNTGIAAGATIASFIIAILAWFFKKSRNNASSEPAKNNNIIVSPTDVLQQLSASYEILNGALDCNICDRVIVFVGYNGGGQPQVGLPFHVSAVHSKMCSLEDTGKLYRNLRVDDYYIEMLQNVISRKYTSAAPADLPEKSMLRSFYTMESVNDSVIVFIKQCDGYFVYASFAKYASSENPKFSEDDITKILLFSHMAEKNMPCLGIISEVKKD